MQFTIEMHEVEEGYWVARVVELPNLSAYADTQREAIERLKHVAIAYLTKLVRIAADNVYRVEEDA